MKVNIIGAGVSGLTIGCYLQMNGFETTIFEKHSTAGGLCTSWKRGDYTFDGCIHWLFGTNESNPFYKLWSELIDMDAMQFVNHNVRIVIEVKENTNVFGDKLFRLYTDIDILRDYLLELAPEDARPIRHFIDALRKIQTFEIPPLVDKASGLLTLREKMAMARHLPLLAFMLRWKNVTNYSFARRLRNPFLKEVFQLLYDGDTIPLLIMMVPLAFNDTHGAAYPLGGSARFAQKIEKRYLSLGGKIRFNSGVKNIITQQGRARGLLLENGETALSDLTISAADWHFTVFGALDGKYTNRSLRLLGEQKKLKVYYSVFMVAMGVEGRFDDLPHFFRFPLDAELLSPDGSRYHRMEVHVYNYDPGMAPSGKTVISISYYTMQGNYWIDLRRTDKAAYIEQKNAFAHQMIEVLDGRIAQLKSRIEVMDITTPATYHRYTGNRQGSVQGWLPGERLSASSPVKMTLPGLRGFYYAGHWSQPGGGLPVAVKTARDIVQWICHRYGKTFCIK